MDTTVQTLKDSMDNSPVGTGQVLLDKEYPVHSGKLLTFAASTGSMVPPRDLVSKFRRGTPRSRGGCNTCKYVLHISLSVHANI